MKLCTYLVLVVMVYNLMGCSGSKNTLKSVETRYFTLGDPENLYKGAELNPEVFFTAENYGDFNNYSLMATMLFIEKEEVVESQEQPTANLEEIMEELQEGQDPGKRERGSFLEAKFSFSKDLSTTKNHYNLEGNSFGVNINIVFEETSRSILDKDKKLEFKHLKYEGGVAPDVSLKHFSITPDKRVFSFLFTAQDPNLGKIVLLYYFIKDQSPNKLKFQLDTDTIKHYFANNFNALIRWDNTKIVYHDICSPDGVVPLVDTERKIKIKKDVISMWDYALEGRLNVEYRYLDTWPPFSDLNTHCIYIVEDLLQLRDPIKVRAGFNMPVHDMSRSLVVDSDTFILVDEINKEALYYKKFIKDQGIDWYNEALQERIDSTVVHETGHFFQLDHVFTGEESMMSYDDLPVRIYKHDRSAIHTLYPLLEEEEKDEEEVVVESWDVPTGPR